MLTPSALKHLKALRDDARLRERERVFIVEGDKAVRDFLSAKKFSLTLYALDSWRGPARDKTRIERISAAEMERISHLPSPSDVLAVVEIPAEPPLTAAVLSSGLTLALDDIQDPGNLGTILRIADWFAFDRVVCSENCAGVFSQKVVNASKGSLAHIQVFRTSLEKALADCTVPVFGTAATGETVHTFTPQKNAVIVIGNEGRGISPAVKKHCTAFLSIPRIGSAESLNAAVAAAIICDNYRRLLPKI